MQAIRMSVRVLGYPRVLDPMSVCLSSFLHSWVEPAPDPHRIRFGCGFRFSPAGAPETRKKTRNPKNPKSDLKPLKGTRTKHEKTPNLRKTPMETQKKTRKKHIYKTGRAPEPDPKPDGFGFRCQFSPSGVDSGVKFNPTSFFSQVRFLVNPIRTRPIAIPSKQATSIVLIVCIGSTTNHAIGWARVATSYQCEEHQNGSARHVEPIKQWGRKRVESARPSTSTPILHQSRTSQWLFGSEVKTFEP
jgi:hypothetical protein